MKRKTAEPKPDLVVVEDRHREQAKLARLARTPMDSERDRALWLLEFVRRDIASLRPGELYDLREDVFYRFRINAPKMPVDGSVMIFGEADGDRVEDWFPVAERGGNVGVAEATATTLTKLQGRVRAGMEALEAREEWDPFKGLERPGLILKRRADGTLARYYPGQIAPVFLAGVSDLLEKWWPQLHRCKRKKCRAWFLPLHGRQIYHDSNCSYQVRWAKFAKKRKRDYHEEYKKRVTREVGRGAKPGRRPQRRTKGASKK